MTTTTLNRSGASAGLSSSGFDVGRVLWAAPLTGAIAAIGNVLVYVLAGAVGLELGLAPEPGATIAPLPIGPVIGASIVPAILGGIVFALLTRFTRQGPRIFVGLAIAFTLVSMFPVATVPTDGTATRVVLALMHVIAAAAITLGLLRFTRRA
ncbi:MAG: DUF6069 family protein [Myxococcota bacterium]|nr:DUF6069 family protein [Myxococcota bacterium]